MARTGRKTMDHKAVNENLSLYGKLLKNAAKGLPKLAFKPLRSWPFIPHERQAEMDKFRSYPSQYNGDLTNPKA